MKTGNELREEETRRRLDIAPRPRPRRYRSRMLREYDTEIEERPRGVAMAFTPDGFELTGYNGEMGIEMSSTWEQLFSLFKKDEEVEGEPI